MPGFDKRGVGPMREAGEGSVLHSWRALLEGGPVAGLEDGPLLERFATREGDEAAFAALVARHGPMVRRVCRRLLGDPHDADDAFQATFLVLARKARAIERPERLANWLYGTAHRASRRLRADLARRRRHEAARPAPISEVDPDRSEEAAIVLEEVARLPRECRVAVVLCDLEGLTQEEAAARLGCSDRTLRRRLTHAHELLRARLTRRGLAPAGAILAIGSDLVPESLIDATARLASRFASGQGAAGVVPASASALKLAEGVIEAMTWTKWKGIAAVVGGLIALGGGIGIASGFFPRTADEPAKENPPARSEAKDLSPQEQYQALVKRHEDAMKAFNEAYQKGKDPKEGLEIAARLFPRPDDHAPLFLALAKQYPGDPIAVDAMIWAVVNSRSAGEADSTPLGRSVGRAMDVLARDHAGDPRIGSLCFQLTDYPSPHRDSFLEAIAGRSPDRAVRGQACLALGQYLKMKREFVEEARRSGALTKEEEILPMYRGGYLAKLLAADSSTMLVESDRQFARVLAEFGDIPHVDRSGLRVDEKSRETLADVARQQRPGTNFAPRQQYENLVKAFGEATKAADQASTSAGGPAKGGYEAWVAAYPKWADQGRKIWELGRDNPRHPAGFDALLWVVEHGPRFYDAAEERDAALAGTVDVLVRERLDDIATDLGRREVSHAFGSASNPMPGPHLDRLFRALFEKARSREARGRSGLLLARYLKNESRLIERFPRIGVERDWYGPAYIDRLNASGRPALDGEAGELLERIIADYGDVRYLNGMVLTEKTLATVAGQDLDEIHHLAVGQTAPEITGKDVEGTPMSLSEFRGKVVLLDFGSHEHCGGCRLVYPKQRELVEKHKARPFAVLGINNNDRPETIKDLTARKEVTWRCWRDGDTLEGPGPITARWNIKGYPTFLVLDHRGVIRFKDLHPFDPQFDPAIEGLIKEAEADRR
jgi:RNA polymerase sigma factor (sigma-70 family)